jgi:hypothetical protein
MTATGDRITHSGALDSTAKPYQSAPHQAVPPMAKDSSGTAARTGGGWGHDQFVFGGLSSEPLVGPFDPLHDRDPQDRGLSVSYRGRILASILEKFDSR